MNYVFRCVKVRVLVKDEYILLQILVFTNCSVAEMNACDGVRKSKSAKKGRKQKYFKSTKLSLLEMLLAGSKKLEGDGGVFLGPRRTSSSCC